MLVLPGKIHHLRHFGLGDLVGKDAADPDAAAMHVHHDTGCFLATLAEKPPSSPRFPLSLMSIRADGDARL
jgi:hypothetical protein